MGRADIAVAGKCIAISVAGGVLMAGLWAWLAPLPLLIIRDGEVRVDPLTQAYIGADMRFAILGLAFGLTVALAALWKWRTNAVGALIGCVVGGLAGSAVAWRLGVALAAGTEPDGSVSAVGHAEGSMFDGPLQLQAHGTVLVWPIAACLVILIYFAFRTSRLHHELAELRLTGSDQLAQSSPE